MWPQMNLNNISEILGLPPKHFPRGTTSKYNGADLREIRKRNCVGRRPEDVNWAQANQMNAMWTASRAGKNDAE